MCMNERTANDVIGDVLLSNREDAQYHSELPSSLAPWYCYPEDAGHSILCVLEQHFEDTEESAKAIMGHMIPASVRTVQKAEYRTVSIDGIAPDVLVVAGLEYSRNIGLVEEPDDMEFMGQPSSSSQDSIWVKNDETRIVSMNFWGSRLEESGRFYVSPNAGEIRVLLPTNFNLGEISQLRRSVDHAVVTKGPIKGASGQVGYEILFEDHSSNPYCLHTSTQAVERPIKFDTTECNLSLWYQKGAARMPRRLFHTDCYLRQAPQIPYAKSWEEDPGTFETGSSGSSDATRVAANEDEPSTDGSTTEESSKTDSEFLYTTVNTGHVIRCPRDGKDLKVARRFLVRPDFFARHIGTGRRAIRFDTRGAHEGIINVEYKGRAISTVATATTPEDVESLEQFLHQRGYHHLNLDRSMKHVVVELHLDMDMVRFMAEVPAGMPALGELHRVLGMWLLEGESVPGGGRKSG